MLYDYFYIAFTNVVSRGLRSWLTMIGIFIGIAAVVALISLGQGLQNAITQQFEKIGSDKITILGKAGPIVSPVASELSSKPLNEDDANLVKKINGVETVASYLMKSLTVEFRREKRDVLISGIDVDEYKKMFSKTYNIEKGKDLNSGDKSKVTIGYNTANEDFDKKIVVGDKLTIAGKSFTVAGIIEKIGSQIDDSAIIMEKDSLRELSNEPKIISMIFLKVKKGENVQNVAEQVEKEMKKKRNEKTSEEPKTFTVQTSEQLLSTVSSIFGIVQAVLVGIAAISLLVGGVGIMNTMFTSILERTREIGVMKAIGAKKSDILMIIVIESGFLGMAGGVIGILIGLGLSKTAELIAVHELGSPLIQAYTGPALIFGALAFSFFIGVISGLIPARKASNLQPVEALRYE